MSAPGSREVRVLGVLLVAALAAAWVSWFTSPEERTTEVVTIAGLSSSELKALRLRSRTATVTIERVELPGGEEAILVTTSDTRFMASDRIEELLGRYAPFKGKRSLGAGHSQDTLRAMGFDPPRGELILDTVLGPRRFELGGRTYGYEDLYLRAAAGGEVFLIDRPQFRDLEEPQHRYVQRSLAAFSPQDVTEVVIVSGDREQRVVHRNRFSEKTSYWADPEQPEEESVVLGNYVLKLLNLTATRYLEPQALAGAEPILKTRWLEDSRELGHIDLFKQGDRWLGVSNATHWPVELNASIAEGLLEDLEVVFAR